MSNRTCRFICIATESSQEWQVTDEGEPIAPVTNISDEQKFIFYKKANGRYYAISPEFREIVVGIIAEFVDITTEKEPKKKI